MSTILPAPNRQAVEQVRAFNRSWTEVLGLLDRHLLDTNYTLTEARILFELGRSRSGVGRLDLRDRLSIDQSFLGRVLSGLQRCGLVSVARYYADGRRHRLSLTAKGRIAYHDLDKRSAERIRAMLVPLSLDQRRSMLESLTVLPAGPAGNTQPARRQPARPGAGDLGWVVGATPSTADEFAGTLISRGRRASSPTSRSAPRAQRGSPRSTNHAPGACSVSSATLHRAAAHFCSSNHGRAVSVSAPDRRMHASRRGILVDDAVDQRCARRGPTYLPGGRVRPE